ncbi:unnamed protein product [Callosobruchus maculatus]|uniref:DDE Tnp4 domain-containing protein n=1 Tax=Callosobruchus maculatus TaxID=64391 RepID=A0A653BVJ7_CALMS|nr:unnamed protein product [Callosobruchus maculatus]
MDINFIQNLLESDSSSSSDDSSEGTLEVVSNLLLSETLLNKAKNENYVETTVPLYSSQQFVEHFRLNREAVQRLATEFENSIYYPKMDTGYERIEGQKCMLAFLWYASNEAVSYRDVADRFDVATSTLHHIINTVTKFLSNLSPSYIVWPSVEEGRIIASQFEELGFPGAIGAIDGTHIKLDRPSEDPDSYLNRKNSIPSRHK